MRRRYLIKQIIKYSFLMVILVIATIFIYNTGKKEYKDYLEKHKNDEKWINENIKIVENVSIGLGVYNVEIPKDLDIDINLYNRAVTKDINELLINNYKMDEPLFIYDPFNIDKGSINIYFHTGEKYKFEYYVTTKSISQDTKEFKFIRMKNEDGTDILNNKHFYALKGLKTGKKNNLIIRILDNNDEIVDSQNFIINVPK